MKGPLVALWCLLLVSKVSGLGFFLRQGEEICLSENVIAGDMIMGEFNIVPAQSRVTVTVTSPNGAVVYSKSSSGADKFAFNANQAGDYRACFVNSGLHQKTV